MQKLGNIQDTHFKVILFSWVVVSSSFIPAVVQLIRRLANSGICAQLFFSRLGCHVQAHTYLRLVQVYIRDDDEHSIRRSLLRTNVVTYTKAEQQQQQQQHRAQATQRLRRQKHMDQQDWQPIYTHQCNIRRAARSQHTLVREYSIGNLQL